ncbi:ABC transporter ATP-binding protein [Pseudobacteroides cellulosolvens]|uniref:Sulfate-transporting ATPase n=1 Tax=Pseudobacteroides cellulosolvens ATCC 35603 = DSM 2933 TaxID=398512 RepID=A0A0L6JU08_9FIRM|nr:ABC transporter ATP-binding protein [Pseudobacteroides cellulosolvens]KNY28912.1 Sulfate-transporting ATPase [Pseudobacteroides cellulosolvens ATCC 35603 = DSM 2933]
MGIVINNLCKNYGKKVALDGVNLQINNGMFGLLGPNGAGKTTLMRILTTLIAPTSGVIDINGVPIGNRKSIREITGYLPQEFSVYPNFSVYEALDYLAVLSGINDNKMRKTIINERLERVNLDRFRKVKVKALSGGMKRRLGIAQALLANPKVLIVDEPTAGLDPEERIRFRNMLGSLAAERIVILSTHIVEDIESTCEHIAILDNGKIAYSGSVGKLLEMAGDFVWGGLVEFDKMESLKESFTLLSSVRESDSIRVRILSGIKPFETAENVLPSIEDGYMKIIKGVV